MNNPKVLVGDTVNAGVKPVLGHYLAGLLDLTYENKEIFLLDNSLEEGTSHIFEGIEKIKVRKTTHLANGIEMVVRDRNILREQALSKGFDYLLLVSYNQLPPKNVIQEMLSNEKSVVSTLCFREVVSKQENDLYVLQQPMMAKSEGKGFAFDEVFPARLMKAKYCAFGCILISKDVLEKIRFRYDERKIDYLCFCEDLEKNGFGLWADTSLVCKNLLNDKKLFL